MRTQLPGLRAFHRILRGIGIGTWIFLGLPAMDAATRRGYTLTQNEWLTWLAFYLLFGPAFWYASGTSPRPPWGRLIALLFQTVSSLVMTYLMQDYFVGFLMVVVSWQVALFLPLQAAIIWVLAASALLLHFLEPHYYMGWRWGATGAFIGFQVFAIVTAALAKSESESREDQATINAELVSTRELLRESSKLGERIRISRELHDSVGHDLTALCLHLEAALNSAPHEAIASTQRAYSAAKHALSEVRLVVSAAQQGDSVDLRSSLRCLEERLPRIRLNLSLAEQLHITDPACATAVLRCVQEVSSNALKHTDAKNLWIDIHLLNGGIELEARDDGRLLQGAGTGLGLLAMKRRFEELGGTLSCDVRQTQGFMIRAWLPTHSGAR